MYNIIDLHLVNIHTSFPLLSAEAKKRQGMQQHGSTTPVNRFKKSDSASSMENLDENARTDSLTGEKTHR